MATAGAVPHAGPSIAPAAKPKSQERQTDEEGMDLGDGLEHNCFAPVTDEGLAALLGCKLRPHPDKVAEAAALSSVASPSLKYSLCLPKEILLKGISSLQARAVHLACARHEHFLPNGQRAGFFLGDGPGVGKGRQVAALVTENLLRKRGNCRAVWFSASADLAVDATRDFWDIGAYKYEPVKIHDLKRLERVKAGMKLEDVKDMDQGVLFCTYLLLIQKSRSGKEVTQTMAGDPHGYFHPHVIDLHERAAADEASKGELEFGPGSRLAQIVEWCGGEAFDGALVLDECHKAKNCTATYKERGTQSESKTSRAVIEIQRRLPNARVLYVSATGATEASNLGYMQRLGLWGPGTAFESRQKFIHLLDQRGVGTMELVAMELKQSGYFLARTLSYEGVEYESLNIEIKPELKAMYNEACDIWYEIWQTILELENPKKALSNLWGGHLRFFRQLLTACKVDHIEKFAKDQLAKGHCIVIGLQSTGEARTKAMAEAAGAADDEDFAFDSFADPGGLIMSSIIEKHLQGAPNKQHLLDCAQALKLPGNPLDDLIKRLGGPDKVAELTGRKKRMVYNEKTESYHYKARFDKVPMDQVNIAEKDAFQAGEKLVAVISDAASTGISLQADMKVKNQRLRVHITAELAWSADKTVQQLGRTHRSNQRQPPKYILLHTDVAGEHRFASAVAKRLEQLGALTHGDRHAACQDALSSFNVDDMYGRKALQEMYQVFLRRRTPNSLATPTWMADILVDVAPEGLEKTRAQLFERFIPAAMEELGRVDVINQDAKRGREAEFKLGNQEEIKAKGPNAGFSKLMNRLLGVHVDMQRKIFDYFTALQEHYVSEAKREDRYEPPGIITPSGAIKYRKHEVLFTKGELAGRNFHYHFVVDRGMPYEDALRRYKEEVAADPDTDSGFYYNTNEAFGTRQYVLALECNAQGRKVKSGKRKGRRKSLYFRLIRPASGLHAHDMDARDFRRKYRRVSENRQESQWMEKHWQQEFDKDSRKLRFVDLHLITGSIMPVLPTILKTFDGLKVAGRKIHLTVMRVKSVDGQEHTGVYLPWQHAQQVLNALKEAEPELANVKVAGGMEEDNQATIEIRDGQAVLTGPLVFGDVTNGLANAANVQALEDGMRQTTLAVKNGKAALVPDTGDDFEGGDADGELSDIEDEVDGKSTKKRKKATRRRYGPRKTRDFKPMDTFEPTEEDEELLAQSNFWERIELPPVKEKVELPVFRKKTPARPKVEVFIKDDESDASTAESEEEEIVLDDSPIAKRTLRSARKTAPKKCMAEKATAEEGVKDAAASSDESGSEEEAEKGEEEAAPKAAATHKDTPDRAAAAEAEAAEGEDSGDESDDSMPAIRYASDESDTDDEAKPAPGSKKKGKKKGAASSDEEDDGDALLAARRSKGSKRGASKKAEEEDADDSDKAETEPSDVDMSNCESEAEKPRRAAKGKKGSTAKKQAQKEREFSTNSAFSEGWVVKCVCGAKKDDGRPMIECEECKVWQHTKCIFGKASKGVLPTYFVCADCRQKTVEKDAACKAAGAAPKEGMTAELDEAELADEEGAAGVELADADMSDADDAAEEDGVTPQKRKTPPGDVASSAKRHRTKSLLKRAGKPDTEAPEEEEAAAESTDALGTGLEDSEASGAVGKPTQRAMLLDDSDDDDSACSPKPGKSADMAPADGMGAPGKEQPVWFPGSPEYSPASPAYSPTSPVHAPAPPSPTYGTLSPEVNPPGDHSPTSPVQDSPRPYYTPCSPTPEMRPAGVAAGEGHVDAPQTAEDCLIMLDGEPEASHKTPATEPPAKKAKKSASTKAPATAPVSCRALAAADENTPAPGKSARRPAMDPATEAKKLRELCVLLRAELAAQRTKDGMPGAASPALDGATEERIEAMVAERLRAKLVESMRKARDHGRQKAEKEFKQQLEGVRKESAAALMQVSAAQRALSKAEEAWEAERSALSQQLAAQAAQPSLQPAQDWSFERRQLLLESEQLAERLAEVKQQTLDAKRAQEAWAAEKAELEQKAQALAEQLQQAQQQISDRPLAPAAPESMQGPDEQVESVTETLPEQLGQSEAPASAAVDQSDSAVDSAEMRRKIEELTTQLAAAQNEELRTELQSMQSAAADNEAAWTAEKAEIAGRLSEALQAAESRAAAEREAQLSSAMAVEQARRAELAAAQAANKDAISTAVSEALQAAESKAAAEREAQLSSAMAVEQAKRTELAAELAAAQAAHKEAISAAVAEALQAAACKAAAEREAQITQAVSDALAAEQEKCASLAAEMEAAKAELARARMTEAFAEAPTPLAHIKTGVSMTTPASASAPAAFRSALKTGGSASKRVSWDPSVAGKALQEPSMDTPFSKTLAGAASLEGPETPNSVDSTASMDHSLTASKVLEWMEAQKCAVTISDVAKGLSLPGSVGRQLRSLFADMHVEAEIYETGIGTGLYQVL